MTAALLDAHQVWTASDGALTREMYARLDSLGPTGQLATALFRANKCSARAKVYRGGIRGRGSFKSMAYDRKQWSIGEVTNILLDHPELGIRWGWREDPGQEFHTWVLYVELSGLGQVSFHSSGRGDGPDYPDDWDGQRLSTERICTFCNSLLNPGGQA